MRTPRTIKAALLAGYKIKKVTNYQSTKERVDLEPRSYQAGMKAILSFWVSRAYARKIQPDPGLMAFTTRHITMP